MKHQDNNDGLRDTTFEVTVRYVPEDLRTHYGFKIDERMMQHPDLARQVISQIADKAAERIVNQIEPVDLISYLHHSMIAELVAAKLKEAEKNVKAEQEKDDDKTDNRNADHS